MPPAQAQQVQVNTPATGQAGVPVNTQQQAAMPDRLPSFTHLVAQVKPAVVSITNYLKQDQSASDQPQFQGGPQLPFPVQSVPVQPEDTTNSSGRGARLWFHHQS